MSEKMIVITPDDTLESVDFNGHKSIIEAVSVDGMITTCGREQIPTLPSLTNDVPYVNAVFYCDDGFLFSDDKQFDKINAVASSILNTEIRGNVGVLLDEGNGNSRGFKYLEEDIGGGEIEEALCEHWTVEDTLLLYIHRNHEAIKDLHEKYDKASGGKEKKRSSMERE